MLTSGIVWTVPPSALVRALDRYGARLYTALFALADDYAARMQAAMRSGARWEDRTGAARTGLFSVAEKEGDRVIVIYLSHGHSVWYGVYLEVAHGMKYAIILPTMHEYMPRLLTALQGMFD